MKKTNNNLGKVIALALIILFFGINYFKTETEGGPQERAFAKKQAAQKAHSADDNAAQDLQKLKYAYTGKWQKNQRTTADEGSFSFTNPDNTRNKFQPTAKKKDDKKKKKKKKTDKKKKTKYTKQYSGKSRFDTTPRTNTDPYVHSGAGYNPNQQNTTNGGDSDKDKALTAAEWLTSIASSGSVSELVQGYLSGEVTRTVFYSVVESLLSSETDSNKKLGFQALGATPSVASLTKYTNHIGDSMSTETKTYAESTLDAYGAGQLSILNAALRSSSSDVKILGATLIKSITTELLAASQSSTGQSTTYSATQLAAYKTLLNESLSVINSALESTTDSDVVASFNSTLSVLQQLLG